VCGDDIAGREEAEVAEEHYVYIYRDRQDRIQYVGYGRYTDRPSVHLVGSHNRGLDEFLAARQYRLEIAGPFGDAATGLAVETALISALRPECNVAEGESRWRFRPLGVPLAYSERLLQPELLVEDFLTAQVEGPAPVLFVIVTSADFKDDGRVGYDPADPPSDDDVRARVERWWQLQRFVPEWSADPECSPGLLVGVFGSPGRQLVIASLLIDRSGWTTAEVESGGLLRVPLKEPADLDAFSLRGRRIAAAAGLRFGGIPAQFFIRVGVDGRVLR